jgi:hypothetical protein
MALDIESSILNTGDPDRLHENGELDGGWH